MSQGSLNPKIRLLGQKVYAVARSHTHTHTQTEWLLRAPFQGFRIFSFNLSSRIGPINLIPRSCSVIFFKHFNKTATSFDFSVCLYLTVRKNWKKLWICTWHFIPASWMPSLPWQTHRICILSCIRRWVGGSVSGYASGYMGEWVSEWVYGWVSDYVG